MELVEEVANPPGGVPQAEDMGVSAQGGAAAEHEAPAEPREGGREDAAEGGREGAGRGLQEVVNPLGDKLAVGAVGEGEGAEATWTAAVRSA